MTTSSGEALLSPSISRRPRWVAIAGNPNVGKSSLFNLLTGLRQRVGNYPGITVERVVGVMSTPAGPVRVIDLPGAYSLMARSPDEAVARDEIRGLVPGTPQPDVVVVVADAANLARSLFLTTQVIETGVHVIVALNQCDTALSSGVRVRPEALAERLGVPVVPTCGRTGAGRDELVAAILAGGRRGKPVDLVFPDSVTEQARALEARVAPHLKVGDPRHRTAIMLCSEAGARELLTHLENEDAELAAAFRAARETLSEQGIDVAATAAQTRYALVETIAAAVTARAGDGTPWQRRADSVLTHPVSGTLALGATFIFIFLVVFSWSGPAIDFVDTQVSALGAWLGGLFGDGLLASFVEDGLVAGLGAFLVFVPQIAMLFICIEALEDSGYLARAAFLLDRVMGKVGLPGRSFLPLLSGFACAIPGIMATRTIENRRDRMVTMAILPLMSCQARLPVYAVVVGALFTQFGGWVPVTVVFAMYLLGILLAGVVAKFLIRTVFPGPRSPLLLELPPYRLPAFSTVAKNTARRTWSFIAGAGPIILVLMMVLWALLTFPRDVTYSRDYEAQTADLDARIAQLEPESPRAEALSSQRNELRATQAAERLAHSYMGRAGRVVEPVIEPLGFDWKIGVAIIGSFAAREVFVPTLGVIYAVGDEADEQDAGLLASMRDDRWPDGRPVFTPLVGLSLLVFYVIALQCMSTLAVLKRETNSWRWPVALFAAYTALAYLASLAVYQIGMLLGF